MNELTCITRIVLTHIKPSGMISVSTKMEGNNDYNGRVAHNRRRGPYSPSDRIHCQREVQERRNKGQKIWQDMARQARGFAPLHRQTTRSRPEINKATVWWHRTTNKLLTAFRFLTNAWKTEVKNPWNDMPISSIRQTSHFGKVCCIWIWVCTRKEVYP